MDSDARVCDLLIDDVVALMPDIRLMPDAAIAVNGSRIVALDTASKVRAAYTALPVRASACTECGACSKRCPFGVDVVARMRQAAGVFEPRQAA